MPLLTHDGPEWPKGLAPEFRVIQERVSSGEKKHIFNFNKKPAHIVLDHSQVREIIVASHGGTHASPLPHQRRGHWRQLRADCFKEKKMIWVRPADINKGLAIRVGKNTYEVVN